jgi:hypothetical protein
MMPVRRQEGDRRIFWEAAVVFMDGVAQNHLCTYTKLARPQLALGKFNREPKTEPKEPKPKPKESKPKKSVPDIEEPK